MASWPSCSCDRCGSPRGLGEGTRLVKTCWDMLPGRPDGGRAPERVDGATLAVSGCCATVTVGGRVETKGPPGGPVATGTPTTGY